MSKIDAGSEGGQQTAPGRYDKMIAQGPKSFILKWGVLAWGGPMYVLGVGGFVKLWWDSTISFPKLIGVMLFLLFVTAAAGAFFGCGMWWTVKLLRKLDNSFSDKKE